MERITFGFNEAIGVRVGLEFFSKEFPGERIGVIGVSLGAAAFVLSAPDPAPDAAVLESMFPAINDAVADRLAIYLGPLGVKLTPLLVWQLPIRTGISPDQIRPIQALASLHMPVLIAAGNLDRHTGIEETKRLFSAANEPKELWIVEGAAHEDLYAFDPNANKSRISSFLARYLSTGLVKTTSF